MDDNFLILVGLTLRRKIKRRSRCWSRQIFKKRAEQGFFNNLTVEMRLGDTESLKKIFLE